MVIIQSQILFPIHFHIKQMFKMDITIINQNIILIQEKLINVIIVFLDVFLEIYSYFYCLDSGVSNMKIMPMSTSPQTSSPPPSNINFQPGMNHIYRLAQGVNGQPVVIKDKTQSLFTPTMGTNNYSSNNYLKHSNKLVNSDLRKASYCNGIMLANNTGNANVKMVQLINTGSKWFKYQQKRNNLLNRFDCMNNIILKVSTYKMDGCGFKF